VWVCTKNRVCACVAVCVAVAVCDGDSVCHLAPKNVFVGSSNHCKIYNIVMHVASLQYVLQCHEQRRLRKDATSDTTHQMSAGHVAVYICVAVCVAVPRAETQKDASSNTTHQMVAMHVTECVCVAVCIAVPRTKVLVGERVKRQHTSNGCSACCSVSALLQHVFRHFEPKRRRKEALSITCQIVAVSVAVCVLCCSMCFNAMHRGVGGQKHPAPQHVIVMRCALQRCSI